MLWSDAFNPGGDVDSSVGSQLSIHEVSRGHMSQLNCHWTKNSALNTLKKHVWPKSLIGST